MKVIIAGSRNIIDFALWHVKTAIEDAKLVGIEITEVVSGGARGIDWCGEQYAIANDIPYKVFHADWKRFGVGAGPLRNVEMAEYADALIAIWDGKSKGTLDMITRMWLLNKPVFVRTVEVGTDANRSRKN